MATFLLGGVMAPKMLEWVARKVDSAFTRVVGQAPEVPSGELMSIELERYATLKGAVAANPPGWKSLVESWNEPGGHRFDIPTKDVSSVPTALYVPQPRPGHEDAFGELLRKGMDDVNLYVIDVPKSWKPDYLEDQLYKWAAWCEVKREWILVWSSFRSHRFAPRPQNECRLGGRCMILSSRCDRRIHTAVDTGV